MSQKSSEAEILEEIPEQECPVLYGVSLQNGH